MSKSYLTILYSFKDQVVDELDIFLLFPSFSCLIIKKFQLKGVRICTFPETGRLDLVNPVVTLNNLLAIVCETVPL